MAYGLPYQQLSLMAKPSYSDEGELLDGGFDMSTGGICGYVFLSRSSHNMQSTSERSRIKIEIASWFC